MNNEEITSITQKLRSNAKDLLSSKEVAFIIGYALVPGTERTRIGRKKNNIEEVN